MQKVRSILSVAGIMLLILSAAAGYISVKNRSAVLPADSYEDKGVYTFFPYQVLPVQVENTGAAGGGRRMNPAKTAYMVYYRAADGSGYQWTDRAVTRELGQEVVDAGAAVERRVPSILADRTYITVEPDALAPSGERTAAPLGPELPETKPRLWVRMRLWLILPLALLGFVGIAMRGGGSKAPWNWSTAGTAASGPVRPWASGTPCRWAASVTTWNR